MNAIVEDAEFLKMLDEIVECALFLEQSRPVGSAFGLAVRISTAKDGGIDPHFKAKVKVVYERYRERSQWLRPPFSTIEPYLWYVE